MEIQNILLKGHKARLFIYDIDIDVIIQCCVPVSITFLVMIMIMQACMRWLSIIQLGHIHLMVCLKATLLSKK